MSQLNINDMPNEILYRIFQKLTPQDLKTAVLVCRSWRVIGEDPRLWARAVVTIYSNDFDKLAVQRFQLLKEVNVTCTGFWHKHEDCHWTEYGMHELFKVIQEIPSVRRIVVPKCLKRISAVEPDLLISVLNRLEELCVGRGDRAGVEQLSAIVRTSVDGESRLKRLTLLGQDPVHNDRLVKVNFGMPSLRLRLPY